MSILTVAAEIIAQTELASEKVGTHDVIKFARMWVIAETTVQRCKHLYAFGKEFGGLSLSSWSEESFTKI